MKQLIIKDRYQDGVKDVKNYVPQALVEDYDDGMITFNTTDAHLESRIKFYKDTIKECEKALYALEQFK